MSSPESVKGRDLNSWMHLKKWARTLEAAVISAVLWRVLTVLHAQYARRCGVLGLPPAGTPLSARACAARA